MASSELVPPCYVRACREGDEGASINPFNKMRMMRLEATSSLVSTLTGQADARTWPSAPFAEPNPLRQPQGSLDVSGTTSAAGGSSRESMVPLAGAGFAQVRGGPQGLEGLPEASPPSNRSGEDSTSAVPQAEAYSQFRPFASGAEAGAGEAPSVSGSTGKSGWGFEHLQSKGSPWIQAVKPIKRYESVYGGGSHSAGTGKGGSGITSSGSGLATQGDARHAAVQLEVDQRLTDKWAPRKLSRSGLRGQPSVLGGGRSASFSGVTEVLDVRARSDGASSSEEEEEEEKEKEEEEEDGKGQEHLPTQHQAQSQGLDPRVGGRGQEVALADAADSHLPGLASVTEQSDAGAHLGDKRGRGNGSEGGLRGLKCMRLERPDCADLREGAPFQYWGQVEVCGTPSPDSVLPGVGAEPPEASPTLRGDSEAAEPVGTNLAAGGFRGSKRRPDALAPTEGQRRPGEHRPQGPLHSAASPPEETHGFVNSRGGGMRRGGSPTAVWQLRDEEVVGGGFGGGRITTSACDTGADSGADVESSARLSGYDPETSASDFQDEDGRQFVLSSGRTRHGKGEDGLPFRTGFAFALSGSEVFCVRG